MPVAVIQNVTFFSSAQHHDLGKRTAYANEITSPNTTFITHEVFSSFSGT